MIVVYRDVSTGKELDRVTISSTSITYRTGRARQKVEQLINRYTRIGAEAILPNWQNGYVSFSELVLRNVR